MTAAPLFPGFDGLMTLSRREGVDIRPTLLRVLTDLYVQASAHSADEERQFVELTSRLIDQVDDATRAAVRARLAIYPATPAEIMNKLGLRRSHPGQACRAPRSPHRRRAPTAKAADRSAVADGVEPVDAAERCRRNQRHVLRGQRQRARADPAQSRRHAAEGLGRGFPPRAPSARSRRWRWPRSPRTPKTSRSRLGEALILPARIAAQVVNDPGGEPLACAARALDMPSAGFPARAAVPQSRIRLLRAQRLPAVAALRPAERTIRAGHAGGMARLDHGGHPRQIPPLAVRRRTPARARGAIARPVRA